MKIAEMEKRELRRMLKLQKKAILDLRKSLTATLPYVEAAERDALFKKDERVAGQVIARSKKALQGVS